MIETQRYLIMTIDPVHVGTGGMRLGRVDNTIVREPGTNLPKIPGTALHGAIRAYAARRFGKIPCAGQTGHCAQFTCPICYTFGSISGKKSYMGVVSITDARILLFPVYSMVGPVWVTSPTVLKDTGFGDGYSVSDDKAKWQGLTSGEAINLGWLMLDKEGNWTAPTELTSKVPDSIKDRIVLVSDKLFSQIVNSNLEVRTSVSINPETGAAEEGALYSYEAIPRATIMWFDVIVDDFRGEFPEKKKWEDTFNKYKITKDLPDHMPDDETDEEKLLRELGYITKKRPVKSENDEEKKNYYWREVKRSLENFNKVKDGLDWKNPIDIMNFGIEWLPHLGLGGMGTRGFGRVQKLDGFKPTSFKPCEEGKNEQSQSG